MGKGFNNYMCKKFFHPASRDNLKRVWMAEQKTDAYKKKQEELRLQYEKEQDLFNNKALLSKESKEKLSVNFMYEPPPGAAKQREKEDGEPEYKFEWQRKYNAPREDYCKGDEAIRDQPFGIQVRNVRCIKCHQWGHINTDKECPLYGKAADSTSSLSVDPLVLMRQMQDDGLSLKKTVFGLRQNEPAENQELIDSSDDDLDFLKKMSTEEKWKLLKKLEKIEKKKKKKKRKGAEDNADVIFEKKRRRKLMKNSTSETESVKSQKKKKRQSTSSSDLEEKTKNSEKKKYRGRGSDSDMESRKFEKKGKKRSYSSSSDSDVTSKKKSRKQKSDASEYRGNKHSRNKYDKSENRKSHRERKHKTSH